jgi:hypothetical protein
MGFCMHEQIFMELAVCIMAAEPISTACFINRSHQSVPLHVHPPIVAEQGLDKIVTAAPNTQATEELLDASFSMWPVSYQGK